MQKTLTRPFQHYGKYGNRIALPDFPEGDRIGNPVCSRLYLFEDGKQFGIPHHGITSVCTHGHGQYSHWQGTLCFSAPDNSDPNTNGRTYSVVWSDDLYFTERALYFAGALLPQLALAGIQPEGLAGKKLLEIGCGRHHGSCLLAVGAGAEVVAVDRYAPTWDEAFHPGFLEFLVRKGEELWPWFKADRLRPLVERQAFTAAPFTFFAVEAEEIASHTKEKFDIQLSTAALEHFYDMDKVAAMLVETAAPEAVACHGVDFRDHRDFARSLEFLLLSDADYDALCGDEKYVHGNRLRPDDFMALWARHGFKDVKAFDMNVDHDTEYVKEFLPRLRASGTRFAQESEETLVKFGVNYVMLRG